ncbi:MAG: hypothetical protein HY219_02495, partial [Candidatus Staskawiczbacteria bacterium]|nr:hypothetical protein [Candidatus Staskawiczbacteria bacterium]
MKSPEQQPSSELEKSPEDLDIDAAKKYLEEVYGGEKSSIIVDKLIPAPEKQEVKIPEKKGEPQKIKPTKSPEISEK